MSAAFTPGPWHMHGMEAATVCGPDHLAICCEARRRTPAEQEANARLIATAPELYEIADILDRSGYGMSREHRQYLREVCAKARGDA